MQANSQPNKHTIWDALQLLSGSERAKLLVDAAANCDFEEWTIRRRLVLPLAEVETGIVQAVASVLGISRNALETAIENRLVFARDAATGQLITYAPNQTVIA